MRIVKCALFLAAFVASTSSWADDKLEVMTPGELTCGADGGFPPFSFTDENGKFDGLEVRIMDEMAKRAGLEYKPVVVKFSSALIGLMSGQFDALCNAMDITPARQKQVLFADGWLESGGRLFVSSDSDVKDPKDFKGTVGVLSSSTWAELAKKLGADEIKYYTTEVDAMRDLANKNIDGMITDAIVGAWAINKSKLPMKATEGYLSHVQKGFALRKDQPNLAHALDKALADMIADGTYQKLTSELLGYSPNPSEPIRTQF
jgi:polar amino acid transport system substrate-binding protein